VYGDSSNYLQDIDNISFYSGVFDFSAEADKRAWLSGKSELVYLLQLVLSDIASSTIAEPLPRGIDVSGKQKYSNRIFIVHGRSNEMKEGLARVLEKLGLEPIILHEKPNQGRTIIEKFTDYSDVGFAVVLLSPDDMGYLKSQSPKEAKPRARQNVVFELGFFIGKLGRNRVLPLYEAIKDFEMPSDYEGVVYTPYDSFGAWQNRLVRELKAGGYDVDANKLV
jgi:predicted nucleotide-binding protein